MRVEYVARAPLEGSDDRVLIATLRTGAPAPAPSLVRVASVRSFVPESASFGRPIRGGIPMPEGRPYDLGTASADRASISATSEMSASSRARSSGRLLDNPRAVSYDDDRDAASVMGASAYAPVERRGPSEILNGRGIY